MQQLDGQADVLTFSEQHALGMDTELAQRDPCQPDAFVGAGATGSVSASVSLREEAWDLRGPANPPDLHGGKFDIQDWCAVGLRMATAFGKLIEGEEASEEDLHSCQGGPFPAGQHGGDFKFGIKYGCLNLTGDSCNLTVIGAAENYSKVGAACPLSIRLQWRLPQL